MSRTVADALVERLREHWGVHRIDGYPGDGINGIMGALNRAEGDPEFILARHEELAAFMANAHAKVSEYVHMADRPVVYGAVTDAEVPPHVRFDQAQKLTKALMEGDPDAREIVKQSFKDKLEEFVAAPRS